jgi:hypothetical protein
MDEVRSDEYGRDQRWRKREDGEYTTICAECWPKMPPRYHTWDKVLRAKKKVGRFFRVKVKETLTAPYWWVKWRTVARYHVVPTGEKPGYSDVPERMLGACFELLVYYVEQEKPFDVLCYGDCEDEDCVSNFLIEGDEDPEHIAKAEASIAKLRREKAEIMDLYHWWKTRGSTKISFAEKGEDEQKQLLRLINLRQYLWT